MSEQKDHSLNPAFGRHSRNWRTNRYVYPVCSRRSGGISIGINLNPDRACTFNCVYCQVDRTADASAAGKKSVDLDVLRTELADMLAVAADGGSRLLAEPEFAGLPARLRRINDVALSGDGEPTASAKFPEAVALAEEQIAAARLDITLVLITNATLLHRPAVLGGLEVLHRRRGEIWAKLDAGTEDYFRRIERTNVPFARVQENLALVARRWPIVMQSCFMRLGGQGPSDAEIAAYCDRLGEILAAGGQIKLVQVYTVARPPAEAQSSVTPLPAGEVDAIVLAISRRLPGLTVKPFYGPG